MVNNKLHVVQLSGHKNIESLNHYHVASKDQQCHMSDILNQETNFNISPPAMPSNRVTCTTENSTTAALSFQRPPFQNLASRDRVNKVNNNNPYVSVSMPLDRSPLKNMSPSTNDYVGSLFHGATIKDNVINITVNQNIYNQKPRRRYNIIDDYSDDESK